MAIVGSRYPIAIDVGEDSVRAVQLRRADSTLQVNNLAKVELQECDEQDTDRNLVRTLKQVCETPGLKGKTVSLHLPPESVFSFPVTFETQESEHLEEALLREARHSFPHPVEELVIDYASLDAATEGDDGHYRATVIGVHRPVLDTWLGAASEAGLCVEAVDYNVSSLWRLHTHYHPSTTNPSVLCHVGRRRSLICVVTGESILAHRNIRWGIDDIGDRLRQNLELPEERRHADFLLREHGLSYVPGAVDEPEEEDENSERSVRRTVYQLASPVVDSWTSDFHTLTGYVMSEVKRVEFAGLFLYGNASLVKGIAPYIQARTKIPTQSVNPMVRFHDMPAAASPSASELSTYALALGLGMRRVTWL